MKQKHAILILAFLILCAIILFFALPQPEQPETPRQLINLEGREFIYAKTTTENPAPVIIALHGRTQYADAYFGNAGQGNFAKKALEKGYAIISPESLNPICPNVKQWDYQKNFTDREFFENILDWVRQNPELDSSKIFVVGLSGGGFTTSRLSLDIGKPTFRAAAIVSAASADKSTMTLENNCQPKLHSIEDFGVQEIPQNHPPTLLINGTADPLVPYRMAQHYFEALKENGIKTELITKQNGTHRWFPEFDDRILEWFEQN